MANAKASPLLIMKKHTHTHLQKKKRKRERNNERWSTTDRLSGLKPKPGYRPKQYMSEDNCFSKEARKVWGEEQEVHDTDIISDWKREKR